MKPRKLNPGELSFLVFLGIVSVIAFILSLQMFLKNPSLSGQGAFPLITSSVLLLMEVLMFWETRRCPKAFEKGSRIPGRFLAVVRTLFPDKIAIILAYVIIYAILLPIVGFAISTYLFLWGSMITLNHSKLVQSLFVAGGVLIFILVVFQFVFKVVMP